MQLPDTFGLWIAMLLLVPGGCSQPPPQTLVTDESATTASPRETASQAPSTPAAGETEDSLPALADPLPPLDGGRLQVAGPADWFVPPRDPKWLARFQLGGSNPYPIILVHLPEERPGASDVKPGTAATFAANLQIELKRELEPKGQSVPQVDPLVIGDFAGAQYTRQATIKGKDLRLERLYLTTIHGERSYSVELDTVYGTLNEFRPYALAVAAGMKFDPMPEESAAPP